jgi:indole-3-glycerol phosphate synthase
MSILTEILVVKKTEVAKLKRRFSPASFNDFQFFSNKCLSFRNKIEKNNGLSIIAEIKKASPSKGVIREDFNHLKIAEDYFSAGASAVSVLTDKTFFKGNINFLKEIAAFKEIPLLRKDFIIDEYQVLEAKANGADFILLICEALSKSQIKDLTQAAMETGMEVLLELHGAEQIEKIDFNLNGLIGINNRNLADFSVNLDTTAILTEKIKTINENINIVSESGIKTKSDVEFLKHSGVSAILVGEHLMANKDTKGKLKELVEWCSNES